MPTTYMLESTITTTYRHNVVADTLAEAIEMVEDEQDDGTEHDSSSPTVTRYATEGQMGWNNIQGE
tara:strand:+ start:1151 stop:1348 length:198 start_codon:yes stop_codon:yes gene_type:complete